MTRDLRDRNKYMERINIRERDKSSDLEETKCYLLEAQLKLEIREL